MSEKLTIGKQTDRLSIGEMHEKYNLPEIMQKEQETWKIKDIPPPPVKLFQALENANRQNYTSLESHYFPERKFRRDSKWPGRGIKLQDDFWRLLKEDRFPKDSSQLYQMWFLIDNI